MVPALFRSLTSSSYVVLGCLCFHFSQGHVYLIMWSINDPFSNNCSSIWSHQATSLLQICSSQSCIGVQSSLLRPWTALCSWRWVRLESGCLKVWTGAIEELKEVTGLCRPELLLVCRCKILIFSTVIQIYIYFKNHITWISGFFFPPFCISQLKRNIKIDLIF